MKPLLKFRPGSAGAYYIKHKDGTHEIRKMEANDTAYLDNEKVISVHKIESISQTTQWEPLPTMSFSKDHERRQLKKHGKKLHTVVVS